MLRIRALYTGFAHRHAHGLLQTGFYTRAHTSFCTRAFAHEFLQTSFCTRALHTRFCTRALAHELCTRIFVQELCTRAFVHTSICTLALHTSFLHGLLHTCFEHGFSTRALYTGIAHELCTELTRALYTNFCTHELCTNRFFPCTNRFLGPFRIFRCSHPRRGLVKLFSTFQVAV